MNEYRVELDRNTGEMKKKPFGGQPSSAEPLAVPKTEAEATEMLEKAYWKAIARVNQILDNPASQPMAIIQAAREVADRFKGKAQQSVSVNGKIDRNVNVTINVIRATNRKPVIDILPNEV